MINFTKRYVNTVSFIISIIIFCFLNNNFLSNLGINSESFFIFNRLIPIIQERQQEYENLENQNIQSEEKVNEDLTKENSNEELKKTVN